VLKKSKKLFVVWWYWQNDRWDARRRKLSHW